MKNFPNRRKTPADYHAMARRCSFKWIGPMVSNTRTKTTWKCSNGHRWEARYSVIRQGKGCPKCARTKNSRDVEDYIALANKRGFKWIGPIVQNVLIKTTWKCQYGHQWKARYANIQQGKGCPICQRNNTRDYHNLAKERGFKWVGPEVSNTKVKTTWECPNGHQWKTNYTNFRAGRGCSKCRRVGSVEYCILAKRRGFRWIGPEVPSVAVKTTWECQYGHRWKAKYNNIRRGTGCPKCLDMVNGVRVSSQQRKISRILGGQLNYKIGPYSVDVGLLRKGVKIAVEYDSWYFHADQQEEDLERIEFFISKGWCVLHIKSNLRIPSKRQLNRSTDRLLLGEKYVEIVLKDWGKGPFLKK